MSDLPFSRPISVRDVSPAGTHVRVTAEPGERDALAALWRLPAINRLEARFEVKPWARDGLQVRGEVEGEVVQVCVVTLEEFASQLNEEIEVRFVSEDMRPPEDETPGAEHEADLDAPDVLENGRADLGSLAAEHLALALDPYPRKPGLPSQETAEVVEPEEEPATHRPFAGLDKLVAKATEKKS